MIDNRHPLYLLALSGLSLPGKLPTPVRGDGSFKPENTATRPTATPAPADQRTSA